MRKWFQLKWRRLTWCFYSHLRAQYGARRLTDAEARELDKAMDDLTASLDRLSATVGRMARK